MNLRRMIIVLIGLVQLAKLVSGLFSEDFYVHGWLAAVYPPWQFVPWAQRCCQAAPYGVLWYALYSPGLISFQVLTTWLFTIETLCLWAVLKAGHYRTAVGYLVLTSFIDFWDLFDVAIFSTMLLSVRWRSAVWLAPLIKLPIGAPGWVWDYIRNTSLVIGGYHHQVLIAGFWFLLLVNGYVRKIVILPRWRLK